MKQLFKTILMSVLLALLLTACQKNQETPQPTPQQTPSDAPAAEETEPLQVVSYPKSIGAVGGENGSGSYQLNIKEDGSGEILYYEYASANCSPLEIPEGDPRMVGGGRCVVNGEYLYILKNGLPYSEDEVNAEAFCYRMNLDGSDGKELGLGNDLVFHHTSCVAGAEEGSIYTAVSLADTEKVTAETALIKIAPEMEGYEVLAQWEGEAVDLAGVSQEKFLLTERTQKGERMEYRFFTLDRETGEQTPLFEDKAPSVTGCGVYEDTLYYTAEGESAVHTWSLNQEKSGEDLTITLPDGQQYTTVTIWDNVRDGRLQLTLTNPDWEEAVRGGLDLETGAFSPVTLRLEDGDSFPYICGEGDTDFLIYTGEGTGENPEKGYLVIAKEDYWNNRPNYRSFQ